MCEIIDLKTRLALKEFHPGALSVHARDVLEHLRDECEKNAVEAWMIEKNGDEIPWADDDPLF